MQESTPSLSLVVLAYRSGTFARTFAERTLAMFEAFEIDSFELILVGNYFPDTGDETPEVVRELAASDPRILCQAEPKEGYMGWDLRSGLRKARGDLIAFIDGDGQMPIRDVGRLYRMMRDGDYDLVKTYRTVRGDGLRRRCISAGFNSLFRLLFPGLGVRDINAKPKLMRRAAFEKMNLVSNGWFIDAEMMIQARQHRMSIGEVPTDFRCLRDRASFVGYRAIFEMLGDLLRFRLRPPAVKDERER